MQFIFLTEKEHIADVHLQQAFLKAVPPYCTSANLRYMWHL